MRVRAKGGAAAGTGMCRQRVDASRQPYRFIHSHTGVAVLHTASADLGVVVSDEPNNDAANATYTMP